MQENNTITSTEKLKQRILYELYFENSMSCADLSVKIKKSLPLIARSLNDLVNDHYVVEQGYAASSGGRRPLIYSLKPKAKLIVGVSMDQLSTRIVIYDLMNDMVSEIQTLDLPLNNNPKALPALVNLITTHIDNSGFDRSRIIGIGIGMPGFVDTKKGINYTFLECGGKSLQNYLTEKINLPVYIDNDSGLIALAELKFGEAKFKQNAMIVNIAWGIGLGMILNGELFRGHSGFAGEFSHIPTSDSGKLCSCGKRGCLETDASLIVLAEKAIEGIENGRVSSLQNSVKKPLKQLGEAIMEEANRGDQFAIELISGAGYAIGKGLAVLIHIINPEIIVLSGRGAAVGKILSSSMQQAIYKYSIPRLAGSTELKVSVLGIDAELLGAAALVVEYLGKGLNKKTVISAKKAELIVSN